MRFLVVSEMSGYNTSLCTFATEEEAKAFIEQQKERGFIHEEYRIQPYKVVNEETGAMLYI